MSAKRLESMQCSGFHAPSRVRPLLHAALLAGGLLAPDVSASLDQPGPAALTGPIWPTQIAVDTVTTQWQVPARLLGTHAVPTLDGGKATAFVFFTGGLLDSASASLQARESSLRRFADLVESGASPEELRGLESAAMDSEIFATVIVGPDGRASATGGIAIPFAGREACRMIADAIDADLCEPVVGQAADLLLQCDNEILPLPLSATLGRTAASLKVAEAGDELADDFHERLERLEEIGSLEPVQPSSLQALLFPVGGTGWRHVPGSQYHLPSQGFYNADDSYALDLNWGPSASSDCGQTVVAVDSGLVRQVTTGWVLIEHDRTTVWQGQTYSRLYSGYGHVANVTVRAGDTVSRGQAIGTVSNLACSGCSCHLHFGLYVGEYTSSSNNGRLRSVNPSSQGTAFRNFDYTGRIHDQYVDDQRSSGAYVFSKSGSTSDWFTDSRYGILGGMTWTHASTGSNIATYRFNDGVPVSGTFAIYEFIPRNHGTTQRAAVRVYGGPSGTTQKASLNLNQLVVSDRWKSLGAWSFNAGDIVRITQSDATGEATSVEVANDCVRRFRKVDGAMNQ